MQESDIKPGDAIFFNTGWGSLWMKNNDRFNCGEPGIGLEVAKLGDRQGSLPDRRRYLGASRSCRTRTRAWPSPCHARAADASTASYNHENLVFDELIADRKYQFVYVFAPAPIKGATGSNGCPIAVT